MLKERRNQGFILYLVIGVIFLIGSLITFVVTHQNQNNQHPSVVYNGGSTKASSGDEITLEVNAIYPKPIADIDGHKTVIWLVGYKNGYVGLESKKNDKNVAKLLKARTSLAKHPKKIKVKFFKATASGKYGIRNYSFSLRDILRKNMEVSRYFSFDDYLSLSSLNANQLNTFVICGFFGFMGILFIALAFFIKSKINRAYNDFYAAYPELNGNLAQVTTEAAYYDDKLNIVIYKNHLVSYYRGFAIVDLSQIIQLYHRIIKTKRSFLTVNQHSFLVAVKNDNKKVNLPIPNHGKKTDKELQPLFELLQRDFPNINLKNDKPF
ncbi:hypothetical protein [Streptococcus macacae]|uniref:Uncharacterized protein n=1 Tax=Streptococcus macacae NCTC 11558 TaxID=764298 RepID=G5JU79_9STRE|nr:hypothetical protein [Streptococcus macacae]EHJ52428.1 hypothetical protein STRMA_0620 [Streptococcus macacae NCTC 11558]SUN78444.1 signal peptide [Streptococcus macacae NCTC 11558]